MFAPHRLGVVTFLPPPRHSAETRQIYITCWVHDTERRRGDGTPNKSAANKRARTHTHTGLYISIHWLSFIFPLTPSLTPSTQRKLNELCYQLPRECCTPPPAADHALPSSTPPGTPTSSTLLLLDAPARHSALST